MNVVRLNSNAVIQCVSHVNSFVMVITIVVIILMKQMNIARVHSVTRLFVSVALIPDFASTFYRLQLLFPLYDISLTVIYPFFASVAVM